jgi:hypothetical protein
MATFNWEVYAGTPAWFDISTDTYVFSGSNTDLTEPITVGTWNSGAHLGNGDPGTDQCLPAGTAHVPYVTYISGSQFDNGSGTETLNDTNLVATECSMRILFTDGSSVATSNGRFYCFDGSTVTNPAVDIEAYAFEQGVTATAWTQVNDYSGSTGGDNSTERLELTDQSAGTEHTFYIAISARPESVGSKTEFDFGVALTYS